MGNMQSVIYENGRKFIAEDGKSYFTNSKDEAVLATNAATLRKDEWLRYEEAIVETQDDAEDFVNFVKAAGLTQALPNAMGTMEIMYETVSDTEGAQISMDGAVKNPNSALEYGQDYIPVPMITTDYELSLRQLSASRTRGEALDTTLLRLKTKNIRTKVENLALSGTYKYGRGSVYGLTAFPYNLTDSTRTSWTGATKTGTDIFKDVQYLIKQLKDEKYTGSFVMLINDDYSDKLDEDYLPNYAKTIRARLNEMASLSKIVTIRNLAANTVVLMKADKTAYCLYQGMPVTLYETENMHGFRKQFRLSTIEFPVMKHDHDGKTPILVATCTA